MSYYLIFYNVFNLGGTILAEYIIKKGNDYTESYYNKDTGFEAGYYTVKEMKALYPDGGIRVSGQLQYGKSEDQTGVLTVDGIEEPVYKATSGARYKTIGYIELETGSFIAVKKDNLGIIILWVILGLLVLAGLVFGLTKIIKTGGESETSTKPPFVLDDGQEFGEGQLDLPEKIDTSTKNVTIVGIPEIKFKANQKEQNVILTNHKKNEGVCFMEFTIYLDKNGNKAIDDGDEMIYKSGLVQPGYSISKFSINRTLAAGEYDAVVMQQPYSLDQQRTKLNNMVVATKIIVTDENAE